MNVAGFDVDLAALGALVTALATLVGQIRAKRTTDELRDGQEAKAAALDEVVHEVKPNCGSSMRDAVNRIEAKVDALDERQRTCEARDIEYSQRLRTVEDRTARRPWWRP